MRLTIMGCGGAGGVPQIGPDWGRCDPAEPRNRRRRVSILVETPESADGPLVVDTSPDLREQLLDAQVGRIGAVLYTHQHADHVHGIDDLRSLNRRQQAVIPAYATAETIAAIGERFAYAFEPPPVKSSGRLVFYKPCLEAHSFLPGEAFQAAGIEVLPFEQDHGYTTSIGFRFGAAAYSTDVVNLPEAAFAALAGVRLWVVDCLGYSPFPTHAHLARTLEWIARVKPERAVLTHMGPDLDYRRLCDELPAGIEPAYDGMTIEL